MHSQRLWQHACTGPVQVYTTWGPKAEKRSGHMCPSLTQKLYPICLQVKNQFSPQQSHRRNKPLLSSPMASSKWPSQNEFSKSLEVQWVIFNLLGSSCKCYSIQFWVSVEVFCVCISASICVSCFFFLVCFVLF